MGEYFWEEAGENQGGLLGKVFKLGPEARWDLDLQMSGSLSCTAGTTWAKTGNREMMAITTMIIIAIFECFPYMPITVISALYGHLLIPCNKVGTSITPIIQLRKLS